MTNPTQRLIDEARAERAYQAHVAAIVAREAVRPLLYRQQRHTALRLGLAA
jgi:hypothetical protein